MRRGRIASGRSPLATRTPIRRIGNVSATQNLDHFDLLAATLWQLGEVERARELINSATRRASEIGHIASIADALFWKSYLEIWRGDPLATLSAAEALEAVAREHGMAQYLNEAELHSGWARGRINDPMAGAAQVRRVLAAFVDQGVRVNLGFYSGLLAQLEAETLGADSALARIDEAFGLSEQVEHRCSLPFLHRLRGEILLKRDPADPAPAEEAFRTAIAIAKEQGARSPHLQAALALAKLYQSTGRPADAHAVLAPALEGFSPTPEMPEIAEAQALLAALAETDEVKAEAAQRERRVELQTAYGQALMYSKGFAARETQAAFARAGELAAQTGKSAERYAVHHAQWVGSFVRGEMGSARETAESFLREAAAEGRATIVGVACRALGLSCLFQGDLALSRRYLERALAEYMPERDVEARRLIGTDTRILATAYLSLSMWLLGDAEPARRLSEEALREGEESHQATTIANACYYSALLEAVRDDPAATLRAAERLLAIATEHDMAFFVAMGQMHSRWARGRLGDSAAGASELGPALAGFVEQGNKYAAPWFHALAADLEATSGNAERALESVALGLALAEETGERWTDPLLYRRMGELLLKRDPTNPAPAEEALKTAVDIAQRQGSRSLRLIAALALAKHYQSTDRPAEAHAVLAPALDGFSPTPEMPEIAEAQALLAALAQTEEVKAAEVQLQRQLHLQTSYGQAVMYSKGFAAEETKAAFARATDLAAKTDDFSERFAAAHGQWTSALVRGELKLARELASAFLREAEGLGRFVEVGVASRGLAIISYNLGEFAQARIHCERALAACDPERDREARERFSEDTRSMAMSWLAVTMWQLGEVQRARELVDEANRRAAELGHAPSMAHPLQAKFILEFLRGDGAAALAAAEALAVLGREHGMPYWRASAELFVVWARGRLYDPAAGAAEPERALAASGDQGTRERRLVLQGAARGARVPDATPRQRDGAHRRGVGARAPS